MHHKNHADTIGLPELKTLVLNLRKMPAQSAQANPTHNLSASTIGVQVGKSLRLKHTALKILKSYSKEKLFSKLEVEEFLKKAFTASELVYPAS